MSVIYPIPTPQRRETTQTFSRSVGLLFVDFTAQSLVVESLIAGISGGNSPNICGAIPTTSCPGIIGGTSPYECSSGIQSLVVDGLVGCIGGGSPISQSGIEVIPSGGILGRCDAIGIRNLTLAGLVSSITGGASSVLCGAIPTASIAGISGGSSAIECGFMPALPTGGLLGRNYISEILLGLSITPSGGVLGRPYYTEIRNQIFVSNCQAIGGGASPNSRVWIYTDSSVPGICGGTIDGIHGIAFSPSGGILGATNTTILRGCLHTPSGGALGALSTSWIRGVAKAGSVNGVVGYTMDPVAPHYSRGCKIASFIPSIAGGEAGKGIGWLASSSVRSIIGGASPRTDGLEFSGNIHGVIGATPPYYLNLGYILNPTISSIGGGSFNHLYGKIEEPTISAISGGTSRYLPNVFAIEFLWAQESVGGIFEVPTNIDLTLATEDQNPVLTLIEQP